MPASRTIPPRETKAAILRRLLARKAGANLAALQSATGWQPHSVRAGLKAGYTIERAYSAKPDNGPVYRITDGPEGPR